MKKSIYAVLAVGLLTGNTLVSAAEDAAVQTSAQGAEESYGTTQEVMEDQAAAVEQAAPDEQTAAAVETVAEDQPSAVEDNGAAAESAVIPEATGKPKRRWWKFWQRNKAQPEEEPTPEAAMSESPVVSTEEATEEVTPPSGTEIGESGQVEEARESAEAEPEEMMSETAAAETQEMESGPIEEISSEAAAVPAEEMTEVPAEEMAEAPAEEMAEAPAEAEAVPEIAHEPERIAPERPESAVSEVEMPAQEMTSESAEAPVPVETAEAAPATEEAEAAQPPQTLSAVANAAAVMTLEDLVRLVSLQNDKIAYQKMEWSIASEGVVVAKAMYEPNLVASYRYSDSNTPNTTEEEFRRSFAPEFDEQYHDLVVGVEGMVPTGGKVKVTYTFRNIENNIQPTPIRGEENKTFVGVSVTQPLLKGYGGRAVVETPIRAAEKDEAIAHETYRQALLQTISSASVSFWDLYLAQEKVKLRDHSLDIAEKVLNDETARVRFGRSAETDLLNAESGVAQRQALQIAADQDLLAARNELRKHLAELPGLPGVSKIVVDAKATPPAARPKFEDAVETALKYRPEYIASRLRAEKEDVHVKFAQNARLPQLDLVASYGLNGLDKSFSDSWSNTWQADYPSMFIGLEYKMPLIGNRKAKSELAAAKYKKAQALLEIKAAEITIHNGVNTAVSNLDSAFRQLEQIGKVVDTNRRLLDIEFTRFDAGQSTSRQLLEKEEMMNKAQETQLEARVNLQKAVVSLGAEEGALLRDFGLEE